MTFTIITLALIFAGMLIAEKYRKPKKDNEFYKEPEDEIFRL